ncbi:MAG: hypothetical protein SNJ59_11550 [Aggregatilineales bacterium]
MLSFASRCAAVVLILCVVGGVLGLALGKSHAQLGETDPAWKALGFDACELPCWAGIVPGTTPFDDAFDRLVAYVPALDSRVLLGSSQINFTASLDDRYLTGLIFYNRGRVGSLRMNLVVPVSELFDRAGPPDCVIYLSMLNMPYIAAALFWERDGLLIGSLLDSQADRIAPSARTQLFWISAVDSACDRPEAVEWRGFAPRWRYRSRG